MTLAPFDDASDDVSNDIAGMTTSSQPENEEKSRENCKPPQILWTFVEFVLIIVIAGL